MASSTAPDPRNMRVDDMIRNFFDTASHRTSWEEDLVCESHWEKVPYSVFDEEEVLVRSVPRESEGRPEFEYVWHFFPAPVSSGLNTMTVFLVAHPSNSTRQPLGVLSDLLTHHSSDQVEMQQQQLKTAKIQQRLVRHVQALCFPCTITDAKQGACPICLELFEVGEEAWRLPCLHIYHESCARAYFVHRRMRMNCPVCRCDLKTLTRAHLSLIEPPAV